MKKIIIFSMLLMFAFVSMAQLPVYPLTPTTNDSIVGAATKYCTNSTRINHRYNGVIEVKITPSISNSDSTHVWVEGSYDNSTWFKITNLGSVMLSGTGKAYSSNAVTLAAGYDYKVKVGTTACAIVWPSTWYFNFPYYRVAVQHFKAATSIKITRANMFLKREQ